MIKFECCYCDQPIEAPDEMLGTQIDCPGCLKKVKVQPMNERTEATIAPNSQAARSEAEKIRSSANAWSIMAGIFAFGGCVVGVSSFCFLSDEGQRAVIGLICASGLFGLALWFFLIAQLVHIRALLAEK